MKDKTKDIIAITILIILGLVFWGFIIKMNLMEWQPWQSTGEEPPIYPEKPMVQGDSLIGVAVPALYRIKSLGSRVVTAYTSSEEETDSTPFITASGQETREGIVACPDYLPFGTRVIINGKEYICEDRMNSRYGHRFDIWFSTKGEALNWGIKILSIELID